MSQPNKNSGENAPKRRRITDNETTNSNAATSSTSVTVQAPQAETNNSYLNESQNSNQQSSGGDSLITIASAVEGERNSCSASLIDLQLPGPRLGSANRSSNQRQEMPMRRHFREPFSRLLSGIYHRDPVFKPDLLSFVNSFDESKMESYFHHQDPEYLRINRFLCPFDNLRRHQFAHFQPAIFGAGQPLTTGCGAGLDSTTPVQQPADVQNSCQVEENDLFVDVVSTSSSEHSPVISPISPIVVLLDSDPETVLIETQDVQTGGAEREANAEAELDQAPVVSVDEQSAATAEMEEHFGIKPLNLSEESDTE